MSQVPGPPGNGATESVDLGRVVMSRIEVLAAAGLVDSGSR